jgi:glucokinase
VIAGIDLGGTQVRLAFADDGGRIQRTVRAHTAELGSPPAMAEWAGWQLTRVGGRGALRSVGIGAPGPVDPTAGRLINPPNLPGWHQALLGGILERELGCPVHLENDANLAGLGEFHHGAGAGSRHMVYITWGTGVGGAVILDGVLRSGAHGSAGEIGHMIIEVDGPACGCGQRGCVEALCSGSNVPRHYGRPAEELLRAAAAGEPDARAKVARIAAHMGIALINVANLYDPELIVIGGGFTHTASWKLLRPTMTDVLRASPFVTSRRRPRVVRAQLGDRAGLVGAVTLARSWLQ